MEIVSAVAGLAAASRDEGSEMGLVRQTVLGEPHVLVDAVGAVVDAHSADGLVK